MSAPETWLVLGASSAIARAFARVAASEGADVILAGRDRDDLDKTAADIAIRSGRRALVVDFDALDYGSHAALMARAKQEAGAGTLNVFLAFGTMPSQTEIDADPQLAFRTIGSNYTGAVSVLQAAAPALEAQKRGAVIALSSVAGDRGRIKNYVYGSAKAGLSAYLQGLRARLFRSGVTVTTVKPGFVDTAMTFGIPGMFLVASPEFVARACLAAARRGREEVYVPFFWWGIMTIIRNIPER
ncbi:MAG TPA: SDR family NAD(P)-dependent oxidoreductase, partial [Alphaproteobacteria bacterium]|nr:SDR family NAD(P)-dependent oxidoreductase [Alphaproteobacteria bacterium]